MSIAVVLIGGVYLVNGVRSLLPKPEPGPAQLAAMPEVNLLVPGSHVLAKHSHGPMAMWLGTVSHSGASTEAGVNASKQDVFAFYTRELAARGWTGPDSTNINSPERWTRGSYAFVLGSAINSSDTAYLGAGTYTTAYSIDETYDPQK